ncbi:hypothetical protein BC832DRAFT_9956 [Gaertneriomyces semiglobifer]|nr:hypothetical protein BC832DRAFT_9956 [Gaertneriomyces semiglobifer]
MRSSRRPAQYRTRDISHALTNYKATREIKHSRRSASTSLENHWPLSLSIADETVLTLDVTNSTTAFHQHFRHANPKGNEQESQLEGVQLLKGYVRGDPDSKVSLARLAEDLYEGHITYRQTDDGTPTTLHFEVVQDVDAEGRMVRRTITYRDDEIIDQFPEESCLALHAPEIVSYNPFEPLIPGPLDMNDPGLGRRGTAKGKECPIAVVADYTFYNVFGDDTETVIASIVNDVDAIFRSEFGIGTPLSYLYVARTPTDPTGLGHPTNDPVQLLNQLSTVVRENNLPNLGPACLVHLMTFQNFQPTLGIAYTARSQRYGGLCSAQGYNTGLSTPLFGSTIVSRATFVSTVAHELGHGMGSDHDGSHPVPPGNPGDCTPTKPYIMHPSATNSHHSRTFSPCSKFSIEEVLSGELTCLTEQDHSNMKTAEEDEQLWTRYDAPDECEMLFPGRNYTECPYVPSLCEVRIKY